MEDKDVQRMTPQALPLRRWIRLIMVYLLLPLILFVCAWDIQWWQAWVYSVLVFAAGILGRAWAETRHPGLLIERDKFAQAEGVKPWDKVLAPLMAVSISFPLVIVAGLDHRLGWSPGFPIWLNALGIGMIGFGYTWAAWSMVENRYFSGVVRIQVDREHVVCDSGPYRVLRHPGYAGNLLALPGIVLDLSSL
jgi:protein-S-isoprenylcysteine O-methyltransferase Ste14